MSIEELKPFGACASCGELLTEEEAPEGYCEPCQAEAKDLKDEYTQ